MPIPYWRLANFYWFYFATLGVYIPYWSLFLKRQGFNTTQIGQLSAVLVGCRIIAPTLLGWLADRTGQSLPLVRLSAFWAALGFCGFFYAQGFLQFVYVTLLFGVFWSASLPTFEAVTLAHLQDQVQRYGQIRLWGSLGFIAAVAGVGWLIDWQPLALLPVVVLALLLGSGFAALCVPSVRATHGGKRVAGFWPILKRTEVQAFLVFCALLQIAHSPYYVFYSLMLKQQHFPSALIGSLWSLGVVAEVLLFLVMRQILAFCSLRWLLLVSVAFAVLRWLMIAYWASDLTCLVIAQIFHALSFGGTHIAAVHLVHRYFGAEHQSKGQALYNSFSAGLGGMVGSYLSGYYFDAVGASGIFTAAAVVCTVALLLAYLWIGKENGKIRS